MIRMPRFLSRPMVNTVGRLEESQARSPERLPMFQPPAQQPRRPISQLQPIVIPQHAPRALIPQQQQEEGGGWGEALGALGASLLAGHLAKQKTPSSSKAQGYNEFAGADVKAMVKPEHITPLPWLGSKEKNKFAAPGFAHGGFTGKLIGKRIRYAEKEPEAAVAEDGSYQLLMEPGEGIVNRETVIIPLSKFKTAMEEAGRSIELPEAAPLPQSQPLAPSERLPQLKPAPSASPALQQAGSGVLRENNAETDGLDAAKSVEPATPMDSRPSAFPGEGKQLALADVIAKAEEHGLSPEEAHDEALRQGYTVGDSSPLSIFDGQQPRVNEFADHAFAESIATPFNPARAADSEQDDLTWAGLESKDKSVLPVAQRQDAIFEAAGSKPASAALAGVVTQPAAQPAPLGISADASAVKPKGAPEMVRTGDLLADTNKYITELSAYKPKDNNGRWKSIALTALRSFVQGLSSGSFTQALGAMIFGIGYGTFHPQADEEFAKQHNLSEAERTQAKEIARRMNAAKVVKAETGVTGKGVAGDADSKRRAALMREYQQLIKITGGKFDPQNARQKEIVDELNITPKDKPAKGGGMNYARVKNINAGGRDHLVYLDYDESGKIVYQIIQPDGEQPLTPDDQRVIFNAISLEGVNTNRSRNGDAPLMINSPGASSPETQTPPVPTTTTTAPSERLPRFNAPKSPVLVPVPGAKAPAPAYPRRGGGARHSRRAGGSSGSSSSNSSRTDDIQESQAARYRSDAAFNAAKAAEARARGEDDVAQAYDNAARVAQGNLDNLEKRRGARGGRTSAPTRSAPRRSDPLGLFN